MGETGAASVLETPRRWKSCAAEITPFSGNSGSQFVARTPANRMYVISAPLVALLNLLDGARSLDEVAAEFSSSQGRSVTDADVEGLISRELAPKGLVSD